MILIYQLQQRNHSPMNNEQTTSTNEQAHRLDNTPLTIYINIHHLLKCLPTLTVPPSLLLLILFALLFQIMRKVFRPSSLLRLISSRNGSKRACSRIPNGYLNDNILLQAISKDEEQFLAYFRTRWLVK